jgi:hypothetical protein
VKLAGTTSALVAALAFTAVAAAAAPRTARAGDAPPAAAPPRTAPPSTASPPAAAPAGDAPPPAESPAKRAARDFVEGQRAYEVGDYRRAAAAFEAAYAAKPHHDALWNAARSWQKAGEDLRAANLLERYLAEAPPDARDRDSATAALAEVGKRVGRVQLQVVGVTNARLDGEPIRPAIVYVAPGDHVATADANGEPVRKLFSVGAGALVSVTLSPPPPPPARSEAKARRDATPERSAGLSPWFVVGGGALVAAGTALTIVSGLDTLDKRDAFLADQTADKLDAGNASQTRTNVLLASTAGVALVTGVLAAFFVDWSGGAARTGRAAWSVALSPFGATLRVRSP